jgi:hypothetical protein
MYFWQLTSSSDDADNVQPTFSKNTASLHLLNGYTLVALSSLFPAFATTVQPPLAPSSSTVNATSSDQLLIT